MRIIQLTPGSGDNFYCENCLRDASLVKALRAANHDVLMVPMYLPLQTDKDDKLSNAPIFFGGINVYLQQKFSFFRKTPRWLDRLFDSPKLLALAGKKAGMTNARLLGQTTVSMLQGKDSRQAKELDRLIIWLTERKNKPDIICLSNILLAGLAKPLKTALGVPVVSLLQDEEGFLDTLTEPYSTQAWKIVKDCSSHFDSFISVSKYYADLMTQKLDLPQDRIHVVYTGINPDDYPDKTNRPQIPTIGYLSRMCPDKGLELLIDAYIEIRKNKNLEKCKLRILGGKTKADILFINRLCNKLKTADILKDVDFLDDFTNRNRVEFLSSLSVLAVPELKPPACGLYVLEAFASSLPVVQPAHGVFPELVNLSQGGILFEPGNIRQLVDALQKLLLDHDYAAQLGNNGKNAIREKLNIQQTARELVRIYQKISDKSKRNNNA